MAAMGYLNCSFTWNRNIALVFMVVGSTPFDRIGYPEIYDVKC